MWFKEKSTIHVGMVYTIDGDFGDSLWHCFNHITGCIGIQSLQLFAAGSHGMSTIETSEGCPENSKQEYLDSPGSLLNG